MEFTLRVNRHSDLRTTVVDQLPGWFMCIKCDEMMEDCKCWSAFHDYNSKTLTRKDLIKMLMNMDNDTDLIIEQERNDSKLDGLFNKMDLLKDLKAKYDNLFKNVNVYYTMLLYRVANEISHHDDIKAFLEDVAQEVAFGETVAISRHFLAKYNLSDYVEKTASPPNYEENEIKSDE